MLSIVTQEKFDRYEFSCYFICVGSRMSRHGAEIACGSVPVRDMGYDSSKSFALNRITDDAFT
jgi:hypothetical protein